MPVLPSVQHFITSEETEFEAPVSESMAQNMGEAINFLNDVLSNNLQEFTTPGTYNVAVPAGITKIIVWGCGGGGGGGAAGATTSGGPGGGGGSGGNGSVQGIRFFSVTPGDDLELVVGPGGAGGVAAAGIDGAASSLYINSTLRARWYGGAGGLRGSVGNPTSIGAIANEADWQMHRHTLGGAGGNGGHAGTASLAGQASYFYDGGNGRPGPPFGQFGGPGGGGGAGALGVGGLGGNYGSPGSNGAAAAPTAYGAGGGGGGGGNGGSNTPGGNGGNGAGGYLAFTWY